MPSPKPLRLELTEAEKEELEKLLENPGLMVKNSW